MYSFSDSDPQKVELPKVPVTLWDVYLHYAMSAPHSEPLNQYVHIKKVPCKTEI